MGRFTGAPTKSSVGFTVLPKDTYELKIGEPKAFERKSKGTDGSDEVAVGRMWPLTVTSEGNLKGKTIFLNATEGNDIALGQEKALMMSADGVEPVADNDELWSVEHENEDYGFDTDTKVVGDGYLRHKGKVVLADLDITMGKGDKANVQYQKFVKFYPVEG
jgi:hypothetical protein